MALALGAETFSHNFYFLLTPQEAITYYLSCLVAMKPLHDVVSPVIHHADIYACAPGDLACHFCHLPRTGDRFFFTPSATSRKRVRAGAAQARVGSWHAQKKVDFKGHGDAKVSELEKLRYKKSGGVYMDRLMDKYSCCYCSDQEGESQFVLCKMYVSPKAASTSAARQESTAYFFTLPPPLAASVVVVMHPVPAVSPNITNMCTSSWFDDSLSDATIARFCSSSGTTIIRLAMQPHRSPMSLPAPPKPLP